MEELKVGYEIEVRDFDGRHKVLDIQGEKVKIQFGSCFTMDIKIDDITKIYAKKKPFSFADQQNNKEKERSKHFSSAVSQ